MTLLARVRWRNWWRRRWSSAPGCMACGWCTWCDEDEQWLDAPLTAEEEAQFARTIPPLNGDAPPPSASSAEPGPQEPLEQEVVKLRGQT